MAHVDAEVTLAATRCVRHGLTVPLNLPLTVHLPKRPGPEHTLLEEQTRRPMSGGRQAVINDDRLSLSLQGSSHWDAPGHFGVITPNHEGVYHGDQPLAAGPNDLVAMGLGVERLPAAIVTRGVVLDLVASEGFEQQGHLPADHRVGLDAVQACLARQQLSLSRGDVVAIYTGFENRLDEADGQFPAACAGLDVTSRPLWRESEVAGLVADSPGLEPVPADFEVHAALLREDGLALGELWALRELVATAQQLEQYEFLLVSVPLAMRGLFGSPANATAVF
jgi:kynurenine formamidase